MIGSILTGIIGKVAKGAAAKAIASQYSGALTTGMAAAIAAFGDGVAEGALPQITQFGVVIGATVVGGLLNRAGTWIAPANEDGTPSGKMGSPFALIVIGAIALIGVGLWAFS